MTQLEDRTDGQLIPVPLHTFNEAPFSTDLRNPRGDLLHIRAGSIEDFVDQINQVWNGGAGQRSEPTNIFLFSFNPAVQASMARGDTAEQAMGVDELSDYGRDVYDGIAQAAQRGGSGGGGQGGGGGGGAQKRDKFVAAEIGDRLPDWFRDQLTRHDTCPACKDPDGVFYDNRGNDKGLPTFKCANEDCKGSRDGRYGWGAYDPAEKGDRSRTSRTR
jgi:hypothetical protein